MKILEKITNTLNHEISTQALIKLVLILLAIWLCLQTGKFWGWLCDPRAPKVELPKDLQEKLVKMKKEAGLA